MTTPTPADDRTVPAVGAPNGAAAAAIVAAGIGALALGLAIVLADASPTANSWFSFHDPVGPLAGKTTVATAIYVIAWLVLHLRWRSRVIDPGRVLTATLYLMAAALVLTFPPFYTLFHGTLP
jgi:hypothetical protein